MKDFPGPAGEVSAYGRRVVSTAMVQDGDGRRDIRSPARAPHVQLIEGKVWHIDRIHDFKCVLRLKVICCIYIFRT